VDSRTHILNAQGISKRFGAVTALRDVRFAVAKGEIRALCGENGAGKSSLVKIFMGVHRADAGTIQIDGVAHQIATPQAAQNLGLAMVAQELSLAPHLSIHDNIWLGNRRVPFLHHRRKLAEEAASVMRLLGADDCDLRRPAGALSIGQRQIVEIARLIARDARILILDEPTATLSDTEIECIFAALRALKQEGRAVIYITHRLGEVFEICDSVTVLRNGEHVATTEVTAIDRRQLISMMLGRPLEAMYPASSEVAAAHPLLTVENLTIPGVLRDWSMVAPRGKILCIAGQIGSGAQDVIRALAGLVPEAAAKVTVNGARFRLGSVPRALARNILFISEDRAVEGLFLGRAVLENLIVLRLTAYVRFGLLRWPKLRALAARLAVRIGIDRRRLRARVDELSGGNQQKLLFGRGLERAVPGILLMNEPTRGVDVGSRAEIYRLMREFCDMGYTLVMTSSDLEEVVGISDVVITMYRGRRVAQYDGGKLPIGRILADITHPAVTAASS
jgi:ABC-type sugar transport system ATPase subunit